MITAVSLATKRPSVSNFFASPAVDHYLRVVWEESVGAVCTTPTFTTTPTTAPSSNSVGTATAVATTVAITTAATATYVITATLLTRAEPTRQSQPTARLRLQSSPLPRLLRLLLSRLLRLLPCLLHLLPRLLRLSPRLLLRRTSTSRLHRVFTFRLSQAPLLRAR